MNTIIPIFQTILIALIVTIACVPIGISISRKTNLIDYPGSALHKHHNRPIPMAGGIILISALATNGTILYLWQKSNWAPIFIGGFVIFVFGLWDDFKVISPLLKLAGQLLAIFLLIRLDIGVEIFEAPNFFVQLPTQLAQFLDNVVTIFWMLGITNAFNFVDSMDGLTVGIGGLVTGFLLAASIATNKSEFAIYCAVLFGISAGIYFFNSPPACIFCGDSGAQTIGFLLAALAIVYIPKNMDQITSWMSIIILFGVPIFDMVLVIFSRWRRKQPVYRSARDHVYHRLRRLGLSPSLIRIIDAFFYNYIRVPDNNPSG